MIESIRLQNFVSHQSTEINLNRGVNVFVGRNGAGKSSVVDAITYALFGEQTRGNMRNIVRRGSNGGFVSLTFEVGGKSYIVERRFNANGSLESAILRTISEGKERPVIYGERKQYGESVSQKISEILGLGYEELCVASIIRQGEIQAIVDEYKPRELKNLINKLIGIERLELAFQTMGEQISSFRQKLRASYGFDDTEIERVEDELLSLQGKMKEKSAELGALKNKISTLEEEERKVRESIEKLEPLKAKQGELTEKLSQLRKYVSLKKREIESQIKRDREELYKIENYMKQVKDLEPLKESYLKEKALMEELDSDITKKQEEIGKLEGLAEISTKLEFKDNRCPLCGSYVSEVKNFLDRDKTLQHLKELRNELSEAKKKAEAVRKQLEWKSFQIKSAEDALSYLKERSIESPEALSELKKELESREKALLSLPPKVETAPYDSLAVDNYSSALVNEISRLKEEVEKFDLSYYNNLVQQRDAIASDLRKMSGKLGALQSEIERLEEEIKRYSRALESLRVASQYTKIYEKIRNDIFGRDGPLSLSLRSWAIRYISEKASEYVRLFGIGISAIQLVEAKHEVTMECFASRGRIDVSSLSGGERVAISLAIRFAMANLMSKGRVDFLILDEPTVHLDSERKKSLVDLIKTISGSIESLSIRQLIIITHDEEIFEDSEISSIFRFEKSSEGTVVNKI